jgi:hypothetical protein
MSSQLSNNFSQMKKCYQHEIIQDNSDKPEQLIFVKITQPGKYCGVEFAFTPQCKVYNREQLQQGFRIKFAYDPYCIPNPELLQQLQTNDDEKRRFDIIVCNILMTMLLESNRFGEENINEPRANNSIQYS